MAMHLKQLCYFSVKSRTVKPDNYCDRLQIVATATSALPIFLVRPRIEAREAVNVFLAVPQLICLIVL